MHNFKKNRRGSNLLICILLLGCDGDDNKNEPKTESGAEFCSDKIDNDGDGATDCVDAECSAFCKCDPNAVLDEEVLSLPRLRVDLSDQFRPVTHAASGSLYGLGEEGMPSDDLIGPLKPFMFTQMAPGGRQRTVGDALEVAPIAERAGATVMIRMPDIYSGFPYAWVDFDDWLEKVETIVADTTASGATNIYGYEIWNEPDWTWPSDAEPFFDVWKATFDKIREADRETDIVGPSIASWNKLWMRQFFEFAIENDCMPDIVCWHELGEPEGSYVDDPKPEFIPEHSADYRSLEEELGVGPLPITINEYGVQTEEGVPGGMVRYIAHFERENIESANMAFWYAAGRLSDLVTRDGRANGGWWFYKFYGDLSGQMAMSYREPDVSVDLDGIGAVDAETETVSVIFGGAKGDRAIVIEGFDTLPFFSCRAEVTAEHTPWEGKDGAVSKPDVLFREEYQIIDGILAVPITDMNEDSGYRLVITPL